MSAKDRLRQVGRFGALILIVGVSFSSSIWRLIIDWGEPKPEPLGPPEYGFSFLYIAAGLLLWAIASAIVLWQDENPLSVKTFWGQNPWVWIISPLIATPALLWIFIWPQLGVPPHSSTGYYWVYFLLMIGALSLNIYLRKKLLRSHLLLGVVVLVPALTRLVWPQDHHFHTVG